MPVYNFDVNKFIQNPEAGNIALNRPFTDYNHYFLDGGLFAHPVYTSFSDGNGGFDNRIDEYQVYKDLGKGNAPGNVYGYGGSAQHNGMPYDRYDASGKFLGTENFSGLGTDGFTDAAALITAIAGGAIVGGAATGAMASGAGGAGGAAGGAASAAGPGSAGWGMDLGLEGLAGATPSSGMGATLAGTAGGGLAASGAGGSGWLSSLTNALPSGSSSLLGPAATALGGLAGAQGQESSQSSQRRTDPRVDPYLFGSGANPGLLGYTQQQLAQDMSPARQAEAAQLRSTGMGLLSQPVAGSGVGAVSLGQSAGNPYLSSMADEIGRRTQEALGQSFNQIRSNAVGVGGLGGSRQAIAESGAIKGAMDSLQGNLAGLYGNQYNADANRDLSRYGMDQSFWTSQRGQDLTQLGLGSNLYGLGQQSGWDPLQRASGIFNTTAGQNVTQNTSSQQGGGLQGALGGALSGASFGRSMGWW
jgi:hypothetical protein